MSYSVDLEEWAGPYKCPCCGRVTLKERGRHEICPVCYWEDDGQDDHDADEVRGGLNGHLSLSEARRNYRKLGSSDQTKGPAVENASDLLPSLADARPIHPVLTARAVRLRGNHQIGRVVAHWTRTDPWSRGKEFPTHVAIDWGEHEPQVHPLDDLVPVPEPASWYRHWVKIRRQGSSQWVTLAVALLAFAAVINDFAFNRLINLFWASVGASTLGLWVLARRTPLAPSGTPEAQQQTTRRGLLLIAVAATTGGAMLLLALLGSRKPCGQHLVC
jgi:hypothetical protein